MTRFFERSLLRVGAGVVGFALAGCNTSDAVYKAPWYPFQAQFVGGNAGAAVLVDNAAWWRDLRSPALDQLIEIALADSPSLELARERVIEARANFDAVPSNVELSGTLRGRRSGGSDGGFTDVGDSTAQFDWLLDPWGKRKAQLRGAAARIEAVDAERDAAQLLLIDNISQSYVELRYQQRLLAVRKQELEGRRQTLDLVERLLAGGSLTRIDLVAAQARLAETEATIPAIQTAVRVRKYELAVLAGRSPGTLGVNLDSGARQPIPRVSPKVSIPSDLVRNRPDLKIAERLYYASLADTDAARADLYPTLSLSGTISYSPLDGGSSGYFFGPTLQLPALPDSPRKAVVAARESSARQAMTSWKADVLNALLEVETALANYAGASSSVAAAEKTVRIYDESERLTRNLVAGQGATLRDLIDAEVGSATSELELAANRRLLGRAYVDLNVALGGGAKYPGPAKVAAGPGG